MRKLILAAAAIATLGATSLSAEAMPISGAVAPQAKANPAIEKTVVVVRRSVIRRPAIIVRRPLVRRKVCRTVVTAGRRVTRCTVR